MPKRTRTSGPAGGNLDTLYLMYDYVNSNALGLNSSNSFFDVFFQVNGGGDPADYLVRIFTGANNFQAFERPNGDRPPIAPDGTFDTGPGSGWTPNGRVVEDDFCCAA